MIFPQIIGVMIPPKVRTAAPTPAAREISVYDFSIVLFTALWGFLFLDQIPDYLSVIGYVVIIGTSVVKWYITIERPHRQEIHREHELNDR